MKSFPALPSRSFRVINAVLASLVVACSALAEVKTSAIFGSNMVLQRDHANPVWGWADKGEKVTVSIAGQSHKTQAGKDGAWRVTLKPMKATAEPLTLTIKGKNELTYENVLVGEVWVCSGQSNMGWSLNNTDDSDLEIMTAKHSNLRLISVPQVGTQEPQSDFNGQWETTTPEVAQNFSAVGYLFGRRLHQALDVPVGLIDNAWGPNWAFLYGNRQTQPSSRSHTDRGYRWFPEEIQTIPSLLGSSDEEIWKRAQVLN